MGKIAALNVRQLKKELEARHLVTKGNKSKLQARLLKAMEINGEIVEDHEFPDELSKTDNEQQALMASDDNAQTSAPLEMTVLLTAIAGVQDTLIENTTQVGDMQQRIEDNLVKNSTQMEERIHNNATQLEERIQKNSLEMEERAYVDLAKLRESLTVHLKKIGEKLQGIEELTIQLKGRQENLEREWQNSDPEIKSKFKASDENVERHKVDCNCVKLYNNPPLVADTSQLNLPTFDGTTPFFIFKLQFEMSVNLYKWNDEDRLAALVLALKGSATSILQSFTHITDLNYETAMTALEKQYNSEHWRQIYNVQLVRRVQKPDETILEYANEIDRLTNIAYADSSIYFQEITKIHSFIRGLNDGDVKLAMYMTPKPTFIETVSYAIAQEVAAHLAKSKHNCYDLRENS